MLYPVIPNLGIWGTKTAAREWWGRMAVPGGCGWVGLERRHVRDERDPAVKGRLDKHDEAITLA